MPGKSASTMQMPISWSETAVKSDAVDLAGGVTRAILVSEDGEVKVTYPNGVTDTVYLVSGVWHPMTVRRVWATGTEPASVKAGY